MDGSILQLQGPGDDDDGDDIGDEVVVVKPPGWLEGLMRETFFGGCVRHQQRRKNEKNIFCLHCCLSFCLHCLPSHPSTHRPLLLQVRRYVYHDVVRLEDLEKLIDCSFIQGYTINGAKVIFLNERARSSSSSSSSAAASSAGGNFCLGCCRILQDPYLFCSLSCKVDYMVCQREDLSRIISCRFDIASQSHLHMNHDHHDHHMGSHDVVVSNINNNNSDHDGNIINGGVAGGKKKKIMKNKNEGRPRFIMMHPANGMNNLPQAQHPSNHRRKGAPTRSPLS